ncbi:T9SS type A sorting domain-containing protein [Flavobacterium sp. MFBS3-15]|uniref:Ig-like domain-containing protein n=1 Tax=Flavobacterium sp. MFBS3-15 TaxID=2989816 RepID=UPI0022367A94|nr:T9SS type A sorting domain-containing protein [Flavobacterium sp. MFBS3-15]MCW4470749.1 T9SS type A sorting domain-containing protein [Flavobacterium sp. MFBS3-15]
MRKFTLLVAFMMLFCITGSFAQADLYSFAQSNGTYTPLAGGTVIVTSTDGAPSRDSYASGQITMPVPFVFAGTSYTTFYVTSNGQLQLGGTSAPSNSNYRVLSDNTGNNVFLAPFSADLNVGAAGVSAIKWAQEGDEIVIEWVNFRRYNKVETFNFQIRMNTVNRVIRFVYGGNPPFAATTDYQPQVGIKSSTTGYVGLTVPTTGSWDTPTEVRTGITSSSIANFNGPLGFTNGLTYTFTPPPACTGNPVAGTVSTSLNRFVCNSAAPGVITVTGATSTTYDGITYQWQESLNGTDWANVTGGTGATTASYTPPNFAGAVIQYRLKVACSGGGEVYSDVTTINPQAAPTAGATALTVAGTPSAVAISWTNGGGGRRFVIVSNTPITDPSYGAATPAFTTAALFANTGQQMVYDGTGTSVTVTGLTCNTTYYIKVYEYNRCGSAAPYDVYMNAANAAALTITTGPATEANPLPLTVNFTGFTGTNLHTVFPGWYEATIATTAGTAPTNANPVSVIGTTAGWTSATAFGATTARINLYGNTQNAWIISPKINITSNTRLKFKAAVTDWSSSAAGTASADAARMIGTDDKVVVLVSTDGCGAVWTPLYTIDAASAPSLTNQLTDFTVLLNNNGNNYVGQTIQIAFQATDGPTDNTNDYDFHIGNILLEEVPACDIPSVAATTLITKNSATINWNAPLSSSPTGYQYVVSTSNTTPAGAGTDASGFSASISPLTPLTTYYVFVRSVCGSDFSDWSLSGTFTTLCDSPDVTGTTGGSVCGQGTVSLTAAATGTSTQYLWYASENGSTVLGNGATFVTPQITATTTYYVAAVSQGPGLGIVGNATTLTTDIEQPTAFNNRWGSYKHQLIYTAAELTAAGILPGNINSIAFNITSLGDAATNANFTVKLATTTEASFANTTFLAPTFTTVYGPQTYTHTATGWQTINFATPYAWDGTSNIVLEITMSGANSLYNSITYYTETAANTVNWVYSNNSATTGTLSNKRLNIAFGAITATGCSSARVPVIATVTTPPVLTLSSSATAICNGQSALVTVTAGAADYNTYTWEPSTGVTGDATTGWTFNPTVTTTYTLTAMQTAGSMCTTTKTVAVTVNVLPNAVTVTQPAGTLCADTAIALVATGGDNNSTGTVGTATTKTGDIEHPTAFNNRWGSYKHQIIYSAADLAASGLMAGNLTSVSFEVATLGDSANNNNFTVKLATTANATFANNTFLTPVFTTVYGPQTFTHTATGWQTITFATPYAWDGTSNIVMEITMNGANSTNNSQTYFTQTTGNTVNWVTSNNSATTGTLSDKRLNARFTAMVTNPVTWSPATSLFTDAAATVPYVAGANAGTVYVKSATAGTISYTATATTAAGCTATANVNVNVVDCDINWANVQHPANATINTCQDLTVYAQVYKAGITEAAGAGTGISAWIGVSSTNTNPSQWAEADWHLATFNVQSGNNDEYMYTIAGLPAGTYYYASRFRYANGDFFYGGYNAGAWDGTTSVNGVLTINAIAAPTADATLTVCNAGTVADLEATGTAIKWYDEATGGVALEATVALTNGGTYYASQTVDGCESTARTLVTVTINVPAAPTAAATQTFCDAGTVAGLTATGVAGAAISWYDEATGGVALDGTTALTNGGTYYASQTVTGCESIARTLVTVTISTVSAPVTVLTQPTCTEPTGSIAITSPVGADYTYSVDGTNFQVATSFDGLAPGVYTVTAKNTTGCIATAQATIDTAPVVPDAPVTVVTQPTCTEPTGSIGITSPVGAGYTYSVDGTTFQASTSFDGLAPGVYTVTVQNTTGCVSTAQVTIDIAPVVPDAPVTTLTQPTCAVATGTIEVTSPLADAYTYSIDGTTFGPSSIFENVAPGTYTVTVQSPQGCTSTATVVINDAPAVPDAPAGDETQTITAGTAEEATIEDIVVTADGTVTWYPTAEDAMSGTNAIEAGTQLTNGSTYYGTQTVGECTSAYIAVLVDLVLGKDDFGRNAFSVYPNPVRDILNISYTTEITSVTVHNLLGQQVLAKQPNAAEVKIDLSGLADATYIVNVTAGNTVKTIKVVKKQ